MFLSLVLILKKMDIQFKLGGVVNMLSRVVSRDCDKDKRKSRLLRPKIAAPRQAKLLEIEEKISEVASYYYLL